MPDRPRLLYVVTQGDRGGAQKYVLELATTATAAYDVHVAIGQSVSGDRSLIGQLRERDIVVHELAHLTREISPVTDPLATLELVRLYRQLRPHLIHLNSSKASVIGSLARLLHWRTKVIYTVHGWAWREPRNILSRAMYYLGEFFTAPLKSGIIYIIDSDRRAARLLPLPRQQTLIPNGIADHASDLLSRTVARRELELPAEAPIIGTIANFYPTKDLATWIKAVLAAQRQQPDIRGVIIGDGHLRASLEQLIAEYQAGDTIRLAGTRENAYRYLSAFDVYLNSSIKEGQPYSLLEAMQARVPVVATRVGGIPEIITDHRDGVLVPAGDYPVLAQALLTLLQHPETATAYAEQAYQKVQANYRLDHALDQTIKFYGAVLEA